MYGSKMKSEETDHLFEAILSLKDLEECYRFFDDLCTFSEIQAGQHLLPDLQGDRRVLRHHHARQ